MSSDTTKKRQSEISSIKRRHSAISSSINDSRFVYECGEVANDFWKANKRGLCCWLDVAEFEGPVYSFPIRKEHNKWIMRGVFCSLHCVKRYIIENCFMNTSVFTLFSLMCVQVYNVECEVVPAPQVHLLKQFCIDPDVGLTIQQFREFGPSRKSIRIVDPPIYPFKFPKTYVCEQNIELEQKEKQSEGFYVIHDSETNTTNGSNEEEILSSNPPTINDAPKFPSRHLSNLNSFYPVKASLSTSKYRTGDHIEEINEE
jgi:hypothetical protein